MEDIEHRKPSACVANGGDGRCTFYGGGHNMHPSHARRVGETPWGWRDAVVASVTPDGWIGFDYVVESGHVVAWHHQDLSAQLALGVPVRVHEGYFTLGTPFGWLCLFIESGLGPVPEPRHPELWQTQMASGVVNMATGRALPMDHTSVEDDAS